MFKVQSFEFKVSSFEFKVSSFEFKVSSFEFKVFLSVERYMVLLRINDLFQAELLKRAY
jgi:hypothetical protein